MLVLLKTVIRNLTGFKENTTVARKLVFLFVALIHVYLLFVF